jgi:excisionase family DNA binding protein
VANVRVAGKSDARSNRKKRPQRAASWATGCKPDVKDRPALKRDIRRRVAWNSLGRAIQSEIKWPNLHLPVRSSPNPAAIAALQTLIDSCGRRRQFGEGDQKMTKLTEYVKTAEAAKILGVAQNTLRKWAEAGAIPMHRNPANGYRLFKRSDLEMFLQRVERPTKSQALDRRRK